MSLERCPMPCAATQNSGKKWTPTQAAETFAAALGFREHLLDDPATNEEAALSADDAMGQASIMGCMMQDANLQGALSRNSARQDDLRHFKGLGGLHEPP